jgi:hypothetical protein
LRITFDAPCPYSCFFFLPRLPFLGFFPFSLLLHRSWILASNSADASQNSSTLLSIPFFSERVATAIFFSPPYIPSCFLIGFFLAIFKRDETTLPGNLKVLWLGQRSDNDAE